MRGDDGRRGAREPGSIRGAVAAALERFLLLLVVAVAAAGITLPAPGLAVSAGNGIDAALAVLVFATGLSLRMADLAAVRMARRRITVVLVVRHAAVTPP